MNVIVTIESKPWRVCILAIECILSTPSIGNFETEKGKKEENKEKWRIDRGWRRKRKREAGKNENCTDTSVSGIFCFSCHRWRLKGHHRKFHTRADYRYHIPLNFLSFYFTANLHRPLYRASLRYCSLTKANGITDESVNWTLFFFFFFFFYFYFFFSLSLTTSVEACIAVCEFPLRRDTTWLYTWIGRQGKTKIRYFELRSYFRSWTNETSHFVTRYMYTCTLKFWTFENCTWKI